MNTTQPQVSDIDADEADRFETLPSKPLFDSVQDDFFREHSFTCPVCGMTGGPTFSGPQWQLFTNYLGIRIPADHHPECLEKAREAHAYWHGTMDDRQMVQYEHTADVRECSHPQCLATRLWGKK